MVFEPLTKTLSVEGEVLLYNEGVAVGVSDGSELLRSWKPGFMAEGFSTLVSLFSAFGWGNATSTRGSDPYKVWIRMDDCFECSPGQGGKPFLRLRQGIPSRPGKGSPGVQCRVRGVGLPIQGGRLL